MSRSFRTAVVVVALATSAMWALSFFVPLPSAKPPISQGEHQFVCTVSQTANSTARPQTYGDVGTFFEKMRWIVKPRYILQGMEILAGDEKLPQRSVHPIELVARAYGLAGDRAQPVTRTA